MSQFLVRKMFVFIEKNNMWFLLIKESIEAVSMLPNFRAAYNEYYFQH